MNISTIFTILFLISHLFFSFLALWFTLGSKVRRARRAFEEQLIHQGMRRKDARKLSAHYSTLKHEITEAF